MVREEHRLRVFESRVLRRIFGPKRDKMKDCWIELHNKELHNLHSSPSVIRMVKSRRMRWAGYIARMGGKEEFMWVTGGNGRKKETIRKMKT
jgi:hypothetical protein